jgi:geranylgeranyl diphosphate synthase type II
MSSPTPIETTLERYRLAVAAVVDGYVLDRRPGPYLYDPIRTFTRRQGKGLRPALCLAACEAFGGTVGDALPTAAAIELLHAAFLVHDDIEDGTARRRGGSTVHSEHGVPVAINVGDGLAVLCLQPLRDNVERVGSRLARAVFDEFQMAMERTVEGQATELGWRYDNALDLTPMDYLEMILHKTCAYSTILPLRTGALIGSLGTADLDAITEFGFALGAAFQIRDDLLDLQSDDSYGKDVLGDLHEGKRTLMMLHFLDVASVAERERAEEFLDQPATERTDDEVHEIFVLLRERGSLRFAADYADELTRRAGALFAPAFGGCPPSDALSFLSRVVPFMTERES